MNRDTIERYCLATLLLLGGVASTEAGTIRGQAGCAERCAGVVIYLPGVERGGEAESGAAVLDQLNQTYVPRVVGMEREAVLRLRNGDPELHNVHVYLGGETVFNLAMPFKGMSVDRKLDEPGTYEVRCDVHPEMLAYVVVGESGRFARPDAEGGFVIKDIPAGTVTVIRLEPAAGDRIERTVEVGGEGETVEVSF